VLVESAFVLMLILTIVFGIIEWGLYFKDALSVTSATRTGARTASAEPRNTQGVNATPADPAIYAGIPKYVTDAAQAVEASITALDRGSPQSLWIYKAGTDGLPLSGNFTTCPATTCVKFTWNQSGATNQKWASPSGSWDKNTHKACGGADSDAIGIYLKADHTFITGFFGKNRTIEDHTVMKFEPVPSRAGDPCKPAGT
jgi:hypothetical protein